ncbi:triacylglycerol lipase [uncultured Microbacterium sp.]|uniref:esterase/lipase family protein n=1 Tax=uncultured Microbacterium sp. TaxID=191216 RepID=UPI0026008E6B|nr:alpha/beta hydrolase [uncultured Microbacterium sp.]
MSMNASPRTCPLWRRLDAWARDYAYAARGQARAAVGRATPAALAEGVGAPIILIPGIYETWRFLEPLAAAVHALCHPVHVVTELGGNRRPIVESARRVAALIEARRLDDVVLLAHSKGGLIGKHLMAFGESGPRIRGMVAVATPFGGSRYSRVMPTPALRAFAAADATIRALSSAAEVNERIVSIYGWFDPHIPEGSELAGARNIRLAESGHFRVLASPRVVTEVGRLAR